MKLLSALVILNICGSVERVISASTGTWQADDSTDRTTTYTPANETERHVLPTPLSADNFSIPFPTHCQLITVDEFMYDRVRQLLDKKVKLIEYHLTLSNYTTNPFYENVSWSYKADVWNRVTSQHGQTLLSLAFNFGVLSLQTLTMGTVLLDVELYDKPWGCYGQLTEEEKIDTIIALLLRDFKQTSEIVLEGDERVCQEIIKDDNGVGRFKDNCCHRIMLSNENNCWTHPMNIWLTILYTVLLIVRFSILFFGPLLFIPMIESMSSQNVPYVVKLKEPFLKIICVVRSDTPITYKYKHLLDFRSMKGLNKLRRAAASVPLGEPMKVKISQYDIMVNYNILLPENSVPVGLMQCLGRAICGCHIRNVGPFKRCCESNMLKLFTSRSPLPWITVWQAIGKILVILFIPTPFYLRLLLYYFWEIDELVARENALANLGLKKAYESSLLHYLKPTHPLFITMYVNYFVTALVLAYMMSKENNTKFMKIIFGSFADLKNQSWLKVLGVVVSNLIWPFKRYGVMGCLIVPLFWPVAMCFSVVFCVFLCLPTVYMTMRILFYSKDAIINKMTRRPKTKHGYRVQNEVHDSTKMFELETLLAKHNLDDEIVDLDKLETASRASKSSRTSLSTIMTVIFENAGQKCRRVVEHLVASVLLILTLYSCLFLLSECIGSVVEIGVFTMMGLIVNAGSVLKYVMLILLIVVYSYDTFNNVPKKYLKLNKALFNEVKGRCKDLEKVTSLPSTLQENFGFKSQELSEQADYEDPDDVSDKLPRHWMINDLTLFVDNEDTPRIPRQLFEDVCQIRVSGAPGPVYQSLIEATKSFLVILCFLFFVFLIVLSFGAIYQISSTNQMMATAAGGFLPMLLRTFLAPVRPDIEIGTVSFKSKLDEIIKNFFQFWPIFDFPFDIPTEEEIREIEGGDEESGSESGSEEEREGSDAGDREERTGQPESKEAEATGSRKDANQNTLPGDTSKRPEVEAPHGSKGVIPEVKLFNEWSTKPEDIPKLPPPPQGGVGPSNLPRVTLAPPPITQSVSFHDNVSDKGGAGDIEMLPLGNGDATSEVLEEVDILIYLPEKYNDNWLEEWSDIAEYEGVDDPETEHIEVFSEVVTDDIPMTPSLKHPPPTNVRFT